MHLYRRLWPYIRRYLRWTVLAILSTMVVSATNGASAWLIKPVIDDIFIKKDSSLLLPLSLAVLIVYATKGVFTYFQSYLTQYASFNVVKDIRDDLYAHIVYLPLKEYHGTSTGKLQSHIINDVGVLSRLAATVVKDFLQQTFTIAGLLAVLFLRDWKLAALSLVVFPLAGIYIGKLGRKTKKISRKAQESISDIMSILQETFTGSRIVKAFTTEEREGAKFMREHERFTGLMVRNAKLSSLVSPSMEAAAGVAMMLIILYGGGQVIGGHITTGEFFSFTAALIMLYPPAKALGNLHNNMQQGLAAAERVFRVFDMGTERAAMDRGFPAPETVREGIEYKDVSFRYHGEDMEVLKGVSLTVSKGEVAAIVGSSGGGKTTLVNLLPRFYELDRGWINIDGTDVREFSLKSLRSRIAVVTQDTILFNDTVTNNIAYGSDGFTAERVVAAAKAAHADGFIEKLPGGYDTVIGEKGVRLSGGEKQRISIARAILKDSPILILDEATSSLDTESERIVQAALENLMKNRTTLVIAHRLSTVMNADKIVVMDRGRVADVGRHAELLGRCAIYKKLYRMQFGQPEGEHAAEVV